MNDTRYNGYCNYETWVAQLWLSNDESTYAHWRDVAYLALADSDDGREAARRMLAAALRRELEDNMPDTSGIYADLLGRAAAHVNWNEIADMWLDDIDVEEGR